MDVGAVKAPTIQRSQTCNNRTATAAINVGRFSRGLIRPTQLRGQFEVAKIMLASATLFSYHEILCFWHLGQVDISEVPPGRAQPSARHNVARSTRPSIPSLSIQSLSAHRRSACDSESSRGSNAWEQATHAGKGPGVSKRKTLGIGGR